MHDPMTHLGRWGGRCQTFMLLLLLLFATLTCGPFQIVQNPWWLIKTIPPPQRHRPRRRGVGAPARP